MKHAAANAVANSSSHAQPCAMAKRASSARWLRLFVALLSLMAFAGAASAQTDFYHIRGNATPGSSNSIWSLNPATGTETLVYNNYPGGNAATLAQRPSDGLIYYSINGINGGVYTFNPATPNIAPVQIGNLGPAGGTGANVSGGFRMAFNGNTLYYMIGATGGDANALYTINQTNGQATRVTNLTGTNNGGDIAFNGGTLYIVDQNRNLFTSTTLTGAATAAGVINFGTTGTAPNIIGIGFNALGQMLVQTVGDTAAKTAFWSVSGTTATSIVQIGGGTTATGDLSSADVPAPNLSITKTDGVTTVYRGGPVSYTVVVTNSSAYPVTGTVIDNVPASVTGVTWTCVASAGSTCDTASGSGNNINTTATLDVNGTATYTITGTISATAPTGTLSNTATVSPPVWLADASPADNTATDNSTVNLNANLSITKTDGLTNITPGATVTYSVVVGNAGPDTANGAIVTDTVPASITGVNWTCGSPVAGATCGAASGSGNNINTTANLPSGGSVTYTITGTLSTTATGTLSNTARVIAPASGVTDPGDPTRTGAGNNTATDTTTINLVPNLGITKTHTGNFTVGVNGTYTLTATNTGNGPTSGTITITDNLPAGLTVAALPTGTGWNCSATVVGSSAATCTSTTVIAAASTSPNPITLTVVVSAAAFAASPVTNVANISGGGEPAFNNGNNSVNDVTTINGAPDLTITKTHTGNFTRGSTTSAYTITVTNSGTAATSGTVTVTDTVPAGLTPTAPTGTVNGWTCGIAGQVVTCTRANALAAGASYPVIPVTVTVSQTAANNVTNSVTVSGGGDNSAGNNTATDPTTIVSSADLSLTKTANNSAPLINQNVTFTITVTNAGPTNATGITVRDQLPAGLSFISATPSAAYNSATGVWTVGPINSGANATLQIVARVTASGTITNTAQVTASAVPDPDSTPNNNNAAEDDQASAVLGVPVPPNVTLQKRCTAPVNCESAAQQPGTELTYTITFTNSAGTSAAQNLTIVDIIPVSDSGTAIIKSTEFRVGSMTFTPGTSGLTIAPTGYRHFSDSIPYPAPTPPWNPSVSYTPPGVAGTFDTNVTYVGWQLTGNMPPGTSGSVTFTVRIR